MIFHGTFSKDFSEDFLLEGFSEFFYKNINGNKISKVVQKL